jgi:transposase
MSNGLLFASLSQKQEMLMAKQYIVTLKDEEREYLIELVTQGKRLAQMIRHAHVLLQADTNGHKAKDADISKMVHCHTNTVACIRQRFVEEGLESALQRKKREKPARERVLDGEGEARLIALACSEPYEGRSRWTLKLLADKLMEMEVVESISYESVRKTLKKMNLNHTCVNAGLFPKRRVVSL